jgi:hypothetical protein
MTVSVLARVDPNDVLDEMSRSDIIAYVREHNIDVIDGFEKESDSGTLTQAYFHGDFDLKKLLQDIGKDQVAKILKEIVLENPSWDVIFEQSLV